MPRLHTIPKQRQTPAGSGRRKSARLGFVAGLLAQLLCDCKSRLCPHDLRKHDYRWSTQRIGVHFAERIRDRFRFRWIKKAQ
jgi:hypothetical protein